MHSRNHSFFENRLAFDNGGDAGGGSGGDDDDADDDDDGDDDDGGADDDGDDADDDKKKKKDDGKRQNRFQKLEKSNKELKEENEKLKAKEKEREDKELAEKGEFKKLWESEKSENEKLKAENAKLKESSESLSEAVNQIVDNELEKVAEEDREFAGEIFDGKSDAQKLALLPKMQNRFGTNDASGDKKGKSFGGKPPQKGGKPPASDAQIDSLEKEQAELRTKVQKGEATPQEKIRYRKVSDELSKNPEAQKRRDENAAESTRENLI